MPLSNGFAAQVLDSASDVARHVSRQLLPKPEAMATDRLVMDGGNWAQGHATWSRGGSWGRGEQGSGRVTGQQSQGGAQVTDGGHRAGCVGARAEGGAQPQGTATGQQREPAGTEQRRGEAGRQGGATPHM